MIKAGLKGDPSDYYKVHKEHKMTGQEIRKLIVGKTISGIAYGFAWAVRTYKNGECEFADPYGLHHKGKIWVEDDALCQQYETLRDGLRNCADIYKNPEGDKKTLSEYLLLPDYGLYPFSIAE